MSISIAPQYTKRYYFWTAWKTVLTAKSLIYQYDNDGTTYTIWGYDGPEVHVTQIWIGTVPYTVVDSGYTQSQNDSDKSDFETNYLAAANSTLGDQKTADGLKNGGTQGTLTLTSAGTTYEAKVGASRLSMRKALTITPNNDMYWGYTSGVTSSTGTPMYAGVPITWSINPSSSFQIWLVSATASATARVAESP